MKKDKNIFSLHFRGKFAVSTFLAETKFTVVFGKILQNLANF
jgi:hypothetical protein